jgi:hypothetical protein
MSSFKIITPCNVSRFEITGFLIIYVQATYRKESYVMQKIKVGLLLAVMAGAISNSGAVVDSPKVGYSEDNAVYKAVATSANATTGAVKYVGSSVYGAGKKVTTSVYGAGKKVAVKSWDTTKSVANWSWNGAKDGYSWAKENPLTTVGVTAAAAGIGYVGYRFGAYSGIGNVAKSAWKATKSAAKTVAKPFGKIFKRHDSHKKLA